MLSDFDLAKRSTEPGGRAAGIHIDSHGVCGLSLSLLGRVVEWIRRCLSSTLGRARLTLGPTRLSARKVSKEAIQPFLFLFLFFSSPTLPEMGMFFIWQAPFRTRTNGIRVMWL